ncbi:MAG: DMT family transporter [Woeseiaceae bacterium]|nr:DMT family transporter [Woeseiaceae bacterium]
MVQEIPEDATGKAVAFLLTGVAGGLGLDLCAKALLAHYSLEQFVFLRSLAGLAIFLLLARQFGGFTSLVTRRWPWHALRTLLATGAMFGFFYGLAHMPLVTALTLGFTAPLMMTVLSALALREAVGWRRWLAVGAGFGGVLMILRPGAAEISLASIACLAGAFCYACLAITARMLGRTESSYALSIYVIGGPMTVAAFVLGTGDGWVAPDRTGWLLFMAAGGCSVVAWIGIIGGYRRASPALLAPFEYTALIGGAVAGYVFWNEVPDAWVVAGSATIIASGLFVVYREVGFRVPRRQPVPPSRPALPEVPPPPR